MHPVIGVVIPAAVLACVVVLLFMVKPQVSSKILIISIVVCAVLGLVLYGAAYAALEDSVITAVFKTFFSLCRIFIGDSDYADVAEAPVFSSPIMVAVLFLVQAVGLFATLGAAISALGAAWLQKVRLYCCRGGKLCIIVGADENTLTFARNLMEDEPETLLIFVEEDPRSESAEAVESLGGMLRSDANACALNESFLKSLRAKARDQITLFTLSDNLAANMRHAHALCDAMEALDIAPEKSALCAIGSDDDTAHPLLASEDRYGYGSIVMRSREDLTARLLTLTYPPCDHIDFDANGRALQDFHAVIIGFGQVGQAVLKSLVMNGQFSGSHFRAAVFAPNYTQTIGQLKFECPLLFEKYDIEFFDQDARSLKMFEYLKENPSIRYVAVCAGSDATNEQIAVQLEHFFDRQGSPARVYLCSRTGVTHHESRETSLVHPVYTPNILASDRIDRAAMALNNTYCNNGKSARENWKACDYFSRMSSRASADFAAAFLRQAGVTAQQAKQAWNPTGQLMEHLAITEHERWCAFHYCMGFAPMTEAEFAARCETYLAQKAAGEKPLRIGKDLSARIHACLVDWEELDILSQKENAVTGGRVDYKQMDRDNVLTLPLILT